ncbi:MAG: signal recognition particle-docking protein FtsY [Proteobacteria bacterium]|nr:signal recognition particle-docking protein FtsY [Pseudomonadota bacterium]
MTEKKSLFNRLKEGLRRTSSNLTEGITQLFTHRKLDDATCEELEELLIRADIGVTTAAQLISALRASRFDKEVSEHEVRTFLAEKIAGQLAKAERPLALPTDKKPAIVLMVGVNGAGKTTTIGKLAEKFKDDGKTVMLAAGDTYRAGAIEQLAIWAERTGVAIVRPDKEGADPSGVMFKAIEQAKSANVDILLCDTAGRLQNRQDLMAQLEKILRVIRKADPSAPHATLLVLDATVGQNAHMQVKAFKEMADVTGIVMTKLDSTAKGGVVISLTESFGLPLHFIGIGEKTADLRPFAAIPFAQALMGLEEQEPA